MNDKKLIALTGGIGSGKSTVLCALQDSGYKTFSSDKIVSDLYQSRKVKKLIRSIFPTAVTGLINLKIDRKKISEIAFNDKALHQKLTDTITPLVLEEILRRTKNLQGVVFVEVPLLFECGYEEYFDGVIVVTRDINARVQSVKTRSNLSEEQILARIKNQVDYDQLDLSEYFVLTNDGDQSALKEKALAIAKTF